MGTKHYDTKSYAAAGDFVKHSRILNNRVKDTLQQRLSKEEHSHQKGVWNVINLEYGNLE